MKTALGAEAARAKPPVPPRLRPWVVLPGIGLGVVGTGLLFTAATQGNLTDLVIGAVLFAVGLRVAGRPFVLATHWRRQARVVAGRSR